MRDVACMKSSQTKEHRTGRMTRLSDIIVGRVLPGIRRRHEEFSAPASSVSSARDERVGPEGDEGAAAGTYTPTAAGERDHHSGGRRDRAARNEKARGIPAPRRPVRPAEVEPHAGADGLTGNVW
ncbi:MAG: hypothetical protein FD144_2637 [Rhodospirillaceae bacterium]|nr:MAG: hypothetical protein FD144_2637 [Rhodospirillaceae bacterium]